MKKAILAGICERSHAAEFMNGMQECRALCEACAYSVEAELIQKSVHMDPSTAFRQGKLEELQQACTRRQAEVIVFYNDLTIQQAERISAFCGIDVIDRTTLILNIFSLHARTRQARLQIEMARLRCALPRLLNRNDEEETHQRGGSYNNRGSGEMRSTVLAKQYHHRIKELQGQLELLQKNHDQDESRRSKSLLRRAALVGYTNAGKSSFMNALLAMQTGNANEVLVKDQLFATLDTSVRLMEAGSKKYFLYDTVGFVSHLPSVLLEAFHTTLDSARHADLLIHIVDLSDADWLSKMQVTAAALQEIGAGDIPVLTVYNKADLMKNRVFPADGFCISCKTGEGIEEVKNQIARLLYPGEAKLKCLLPYKKMKLFDQYRQVLDISIISQNEQGMILSLRGPQQYIHAFSSYQI